MTSTEHDIDSDDVEQNFDEIMADYTNTLAVVDDTAVNSIYLGPVNPELLIEALQTIQEFGEDHWVHLHALESTDDEDDLAYLLKSDVDASRAVMVAGGINNSDDVQAFQPVETERDASEKPQGENL